MTAVALWALLVMTMVDAGLLLVLIDSVERRSKRASPERVS